MPGLASDEVQLTIKQHFLPLAKRLEKGHPIPIKTNNLDIIKCPMTSGRDLQGIRFVIEGYLNNLPQGMKAPHATSGRKVMSDDKTEFWIIL